MTSPPIKSRSNALVRRFRALKLRGPDEDVGLLEGDTLVEEALAAEATLLEVAVSEEAARRPRARALMGQAEGRGVPVRVVAGAVLDELSEAETSQGLLALVKRPAFDEAAVFRTPALVVVACAIQNPGNLGGLLRTAEGAGATGAVLTRGTADPLSWKALRGAMGSAFRLPQVRGLALGDALRRLRDHGVRVLATAADGAVRYDAIDLRGPIALLLGNEGAGLPEEALRAADERVIIPLAPPVESLNVGVAAGVLLFEAARQRRKAGARS